MTILVTGAGGGIGQALVLSLRSCSDERVVGFYRNGCPSSEDVCIDLANSEAVSMSIKMLRPSIIYHLAGGFSGNFESDFQANVLCAKNVLDAVRSSSLKTRVVFVGSAAEYGAVAVQENPITESHACRPISIYGLTKYYQTQLGLLYSRLYGIDVLVGRLFNVVGPKMSKMLFSGRAAELIRLYKEGKCDRLQFGNLSSVRDYLSVDETVSRLKTLAERGVRGEVYNVASGTPITMRALLDLMLSDAGIPPSVVVEAPSNQIGRAGLDVTCIYADVAKFNSLLDPLQPKLQADASAPLRE